MSFLIAISSAEIAMGYVRHKPGDGRWAIRKGAKARRVEKAGEEARHEK